MFVGPGKQDKTGQIEVETNADPNPGSASASASAPLLAYSEYLRYQSAASMYLHVLKVGSPYRHIRT